LGHHGVLLPGIRFLPKPYMTATLARKVREVLDETGYKRSCKRATSRTDFVRVIAPWRQ
jgi:hypothetical protein